MKLSIQQEQCEPNTMREQVLEALRSQPPGHYKNVIRGAALELGIKTIALVMLLRGGVHFGPAKSKRKQPDGNMAGYERAL